MNDRAIPAPSNALHNNLAQWASDILESDSGRVRRESKPVKDEISGCHGRVRMLTQAGPQADRSRWDLFLLL